MSVGRQLLDVLRVRDVRGLGLLLSRFGLVGISATLTYLVVANALIALAATSATTASLIAYAAGALVSFLGHSQFTYDVGDVKARHVVRFLVVQAFGVAISYYAIVFVVDGLGQAAVWGTVLTAILVPAASFIVMTLWVFIPEPHRP